MDIKTLIPLKHWYSETAEIKTGKNKPHMTNREKEERWKMHLWETEMDK